MHGFVFMDVICYSGRICFDLSLPDAFVPRVFGHLFHLCCCSFLAQGLSVAALAGQAPPRTFAWCVQVAIGGRPMASKQSICIVRIVSNTNNL